MTDVVAVLSIPIEADPRKIEAALARAQAALEKTERSGERAGRGIGDGVGAAAPRIQKTERDLLTLARVTAQLERESGDLAGAQRTLRAALEQVDQSTVAAINTKRQLLRVENELAAAGQKSAGGIKGLVTALGPLGTALSAVGVGFAVDQVIQFGVGAAQSANQLEQSAAVIRQLAGSQQRYDQIVQLATGNQRLFGGSLNENLVPLNSLLQLANRTGAELNNLNQTTQLLLASAPGKSFGDASFGLSEFLSGTGAEAAISLADQFNLPKAALAELAQAGTTAEQRLAGLQELLAAQGVTAETLAARLDTNAAAYDRLGVAIDNTKLKLGSLLAEGFAPAAQGATALLERMTGQGNVFDQQAAQIAATATSYDDYIARMRELQTATAEADANQQGWVSGLTAIFPTLKPAADGLFQLTSQTQNLSQAQLGYVQSLSAQGAAAGQAVAMAQQHAGALQALNVGMQQAQGALDGYLGQMMNLAAANEGNFAQLQVLVTAFNAGDITVQQFAASLAALEVSTQASAAAAQGHTDALMGEADATREVIDAAQQDAAAKAEQAAQAELVALRNEDLIAAIQGVVAAGQSGIGISSAIAGQHGVEAGTVASLIGLYQQLQAARAGQTVAANQATRRGRDGGLDEARTGGGGQAPGLTRAQRERIEAQKAAAFEAELQARITDATGTTAQRLAQVNAELAKAPKFSKEAMDLEVRRAQLQAQIAREAAKGTGGGKGKGKGAGGGGKSEAEKEAEKEASQLGRISDQLHDRQLDAERSYQERMSDLIAEFSRRRAEAAEDFADQQVEDRLGFYKALKSIDDQGIRQQASAEYEAMASYATELRDTKGADVAGKYEAAAAQIAAARAQRAAEQKKLDEEAKKDKGKQGDADYARDLDQMERAAEQRKLDRIARGDDSINEQEADARADAEAQRQEALSSAARTAGEALAELEGKKTGATELTNAALQTQLQLYDQLAQRGGLPAGTAAPAAAGGSATPAAAPAAATSPTGGLPGAASSGGPVAVTDTQIAEVVRELANVRRELGDLGRRLPFER